jgi:hypothetical protein
MTKSVSWPSVLVAVVLTLALVGLIAYARGPKHHRGDEIGTHGTKIVIVRPAR